MIDLAVLFHAAQVFVSLCLPSCPCGNALITMQKKKKSPVLTKPPPNCNFYVEVKTGEDYYCSYFSSPRPQTLLQTQFAASCNIISKWRTRRALQTWTMFFPPGCLSHYLQTVARDLLCHTDTQLLQTVFPQGQHIAHFVQVSLYLNNGDAAEETWIRGKLCWLLLVFRANFDDGVMYICFLFIICHILPFQLITCIFLNPFVFV